MEVGLADGGATAFAPSSCRARCCSRAVPHGRPHFGRAAACSGPCRPPCRTGRGAGQAVAWPRRWRRAPEGLAMAAHQEPVPQRVCPAAGKPTGAGSAAHGAVRKAPKIREGIGAFLEKRPADFVRLRQVNAPRTGDEDSGRRPANLSPPIAALRAWTSLEGVRVLDLSRVFAGPLCRPRCWPTLGADVIKVERPAGATTRLGMRHRQRPRPPTTTA